MPEFTKPKISVALSKELRIKHTVDKISDGKLEAVIKRSYHPEFAFMQPTVYIREKTTWIHRLFGSDKTIARFALYSSSATIHQKHLHTELYKQTVDILEQLGILKVKIV